MWIFTKGLSTQNELVIIYYIFASMSTYQNRG